MSTTTEPRYTTPINGRGPDGNVFVITSTARIRLKRLGHPREEIEAFTARVMDSKSYRDALSIIREFFPVDIDDDE